MALEDELRRAERGLAALAADRVHGAAELAAQGLALLAALAAAAERQGADPLLACRLLAARLATVRPSMAALGNWAAAYMPALRERNSAAEASALLEAEREALEQRLDAVIRAAVAAAASLLTLSYSSTLVRALKGLGRRMRVVIGEGRPLLEGRRTATLLAAAGHDVVLVSDAALARLAGEVDAVLLGADTVGRDGSAINKTGSLAAALGARKRGRPCYVAADRFKLEPRRDGPTIPLEEMPGAELWPEHPALCRNLYFEAVSAGLITALLTDRGRFAPAQLAPLLREMAAPLDALGATLPS
jgi:translation initiation factor 2B subunit (eIF-2B alpha/beta/delta family)